MAIRTNYIAEADIESSVGDISADLDGIGQEKTSVEPDGKPIEPQIQGTGSVYDKDIANTDGVIPDKALANAETRDRLATEAALASIIDENKLIEYVANRLRRRSVSEAPEPTDPTVKHFLEGDEFDAGAKSASSSKTPDLDKAIKDLPKSNNTKFESKKVSKTDEAFFDAPEPTDPTKKSVAEGVRADIQSIINKLNEACGIAETSKDRRIKVIEAVITDEIKKKYGPMLLELAKIDPSGKAVAEAAKKIAKYKDEAKKRVTKALLKKDAKDKKEKVSKKMECNGKC